MPFVEDDRSLRAPAYERPIRFTYDRRLDEHGGFRYVYENGAINCSRISQYAETCQMSPVEMNAIGRRRLPFVYMDVGRWGGQEYSFAMISGPDVYLCEYVPGESFRDDRVPQCRNASANEFFTQLWALSCGARVLNYARAENVAPRTVNDNHIYLLLPDFHLPPITWFYQRGAVAVMPANLYRDPPSWFQRTQPFSRNPHYYRGLYGLKVAADQGGQPPSHEADIFSPAGRHLARFLRALTSLNGALLSRLHFISMGDMFELWLDRPYQFESGGVRPRFRAGGQNNAADWTAEVMLFNMDVIEAHRELAGAGLAEIQYLWGNHDAYLMDPAVTGQVSLSRRNPNYRGLNEDLWVEHGHRFDSSNHDAISSSSGPFWANVAFYFPSIRRAEPIGRGAVTLLTGAPEERDSYLLGASLVYLNLRFDQQRKPFSVFCMGHTHRRLMRVYNITAQYSLHGGVQ